MYFFENINFDCIDIKEYYEFSRKSIFTTIPWINYLKEDNLGSSPIIIRIRRNDKFIGYFTGLKIKKLGIPIIGSPFPGWGTSWMGLDVNEDENIIEIYKELVPYMFKKFKCMYITIADRNLKVEDAKKYFHTVTANSLQLSVNRSDEELFKVFKSDCRNFIRQFERRGATLEIVQPNDEFVENFYLQLIDVFDKQGMNPTWTVDKVKCLLRNLSEENMVLCLQVKDIEGNCIASSIFPGFRDKFFYWAGVSFRSGQHFRPNEYMIWSAIKYWREKGAKEFDMVGVRDYKKKFGPEEVQYAILEVAKPWFLICLKNLAKSLYYKSLKWKH